MDITDKWTPVLYKYRNFENLYNIRLLENNEVFFSLPKNFNDPYDCSFSVTMVGASIDELIEGLKVYANNNLAKIISGGIRSKEEWIEWQVNNYKSDHVGYCKQGETLTLAYIATHGVFSLTPYWDNLLMWSHYAISHTGYCVGLNKNNLLDGLLREAGSDIFFLDVKYQDEYPEIHLIKDSDEDLLRVFSVKSKAWDYKDEVRIVIANETDPGGGGRKIVLTDNIIEEVVLGMNTSTAHEDKIVQVLQSLAVRPKLYKAVRKEREFGLDRIELSY